MDLKTMTIIVEALQGYEELLDHARGVMTIFCILLISIILLAIIVLIYLKTEDMEAV